jgi:hypothetical protein
MHQLKEQTKRRAAYFTTVSSFVSCAFEDTKLGEALTSYYTLCPAGANDAPPLFFFFAVVVGCPAFLSPLPPALFLLLQCHCDEQRRS